MTVHQSASEYQLLSPQGRAETWTPDAFWKMAFDPSHPKNTPHMGYLMAQFDFKEDWSTWEKHPNGDEVVVVLQGEATFILEQDSGQQEIPLVAGNYVVVPQNTWHTANIVKPANMLFLTWGYGTENRER